MSDLGSSPTATVMAQDAFPEENRLDVRSRESRSSSMRLSLLGLILSVIGLGLAVIPSLATERALPNPFESKEEVQRRNEGVPAKAGGITLRVKNFSINFFGKDVKQPVPAQPAPAPALTNDPVRWLMISGCVLALVSIVIVSVAHLRERHGFMVCTAMSCSVAALTWQFLAFGIMLGVAAAVLFLLIAALCR